MRLEYNHKALVIVGPTASGKTKLAVKLAAAFDGEVVSADSRQVYRGMDVGTGKDLAEYTLQTPISKYQVPDKSKSKNLKSKIKPIPYHCVDVVSPKTEFNLAKYVKCATRAIKDIQKRGKLPILVGGTGLYAQAIVDGYALSGVKPDKKLRARLEKLSVEELLKKLNKLDNSFSGDVENKRYLIRYIELVSRGKEKLKTLLTKQGSAYDCLILGIDVPRAELNARIDKRLLCRMQKEGMIEEIARLHKAGVSWKRLESFGLEYRFVSQYLQGKLAYEDMVEKLAIAIHQFAKKQLTWLRRWERQGRRIYWVREYAAAKYLIKEWLEN